MTLEQIKAAQRKIDRPKIATASETDNARHIR